MPWISTLPRPLIAKTFSTTTVPAISSAKAMPMTVTTGIRAFGKAWTMTSRRRTRPLAVATCMKSAFSTSSIDERIMRAMIAAKGVPTAIEGRIRWESHGHSPSESGA